MMASDDCPETRELRFGDLVRVSSYGQSVNLQLRDDRGVGRVQQVNDDSTFDIVWILGGKTNKVPRDHLLHTTAAKEGLTDDSSRRAKKRPQNFNDYVQEPSRKTKVSKKETIKKPTKKTVAAKKVAATVTKKKKGKKEAPQQQEPTPKKSEYDLFDRHYRTLIATLNKCVKLGPDFDWKQIQQKAEKKAFKRDRTAAEKQQRMLIFGSYYAQKTPKKESVRCLNKFGVDWNKFRAEVMDVIQKHGPDEEIWAERIKELVDTNIERLADKQEEEMQKADELNYLLSAVHKTNREAAMQSWRKIPFLERQYERLSTDAVCAGLSQVDEKIAKYELETSLPDSFIGMAYRFDDTGQSEAWMKSVVDETGLLKQKRSKKEQQAALALASDEGVTRAQVNACMQSLLIQVQDKVMTDRHVLAQNELRSANWEGVSEPEIVEQPVWGIDCYTRTHITHILELEIDTATALEFVEKWLLPAINACPVDLAHDIEYPARILEGLPLRIPTENDEDAQIGSTETAEWSHSFLGEALKQKIKTSAPTWLKGAANLVRRARALLGLDFFRVHPKGHGSVVLSEKIPPNTLVTFYRGELYPSWRWGEKMDAIEITQQRKQLKPNLPDFYNMALERPQSDPRGYGLLFVDASRKGGHGSQLSHSCDPSCEVRVASRNGKLCLVMTTLRELEMGEELTFDYNAVTESLNEYQSAVCLCGYKRCRGSFLHFATADCYQQVLNRNAPIAARFSNLVKGSMKQVMSEEDEKTLSNHGFQTAAFGAISVNRYCNTESDGNLSDTLDIVPIWLRTYVADVLRYIEYERRALPIALICNDITKERKGLSKGDKDPEEITQAPKKPEPAIAVFRRLEKKKISEFSNTDEGKSLGNRNKAASHLWKELDQSEKDRYIKIADTEYKEKIQKIKDEIDKKASGKQEKFVQQMSFQDADAEGVAAMEQRIQQLTQAMSRVGRVLDRHRDMLVTFGDVSTDIESLRNAVHSPIKFMTDAEVIDWMWNQEKGLVKSLIAGLCKLKSAPAELTKSIEGVREAFSHLESVDPKQADASARLRKDLKNGLLRIAECMKKELNRMGRHHRSLTSLKKREKKLTTAIETAVAEEPMEVTENDGDVGNTIEDEMETDDRAAVEKVISDLVDKVVNRLDPKPLTPEEELKVVEAEIAKLSNANPWLKHFGSRWPIQAAVDLIIMYAHTKNYFMLKPYQELKSSPVEVYAREVGNSVPLTVIDDELLKSILKTGQPEQEHTLPTESASQMDTQGTSGTQSGDDNLPPTKVQLDSRSKKQALESEEELCDPADIVSKVTVEYRGDYVLSQLLQWSNGGIGQKPGLPDLYGSVLLPGIEDCLLGKRRKMEGTGVTYPYNIETRARLVSWLQDPLRRGSPWPDDVRVAFSSSDVDSPLLSCDAPFGSPIIDFLATGDETSIHEILKIFDADDMISNRRSVDNMLASVDKGRPAQAVCNWVQCENPECRKWRKVAWHIDLDTLPDDFYCKDNKWDPAHSSCDVPQEDWDADDKLVGKDGKIEGSPFRKKNEILSPDKEESFTVGARFDVQRRMKNGKLKYCVASVVKVDFSGAKKQIHFHFAKSKNENDEWIELGSDRIKPLFSESTKKEPKVEKSEAKEETLKSEQKEIQHTTSVSTAKDSKLDQKASEPSLAKPAPVPQQASAQAPIGQSAMPSVSSSVPFPFHLANGPRPDLQGKALHGLSNASNFVNSLNGNRPYIAAPPRFAVPPAPKPVPAPAASPTGPAPRFAGQFSESPQPARPVINPAFLQQLNMLAQSTQDAQNAAVLLELLRGRPNNNGN